MNWHLFLMSFNKKHSRPVCPFCGRTMMPGQDGWYCTCKEWNAARRKAWRAGLIE